jgi:Flp pilus assembly protein TadB
VGTAEPEQRPQYRSHGDHTGDHEHPHRQTHMHGGSDVDPRTAVRRRRTNVLFVLVITAACTLFLAATTSSTVMVYLFALAFLALCGYVYLLAQLRQRDSSQWNNGWLERR